MTRAADRASPLAFGILAMLAYEPMHPYRLQQLLKAWGKDQVIDVRQRGSLYQTIQRLEALGWVQVHATEQVEKRPARTIYRITSAGTEAMGRWMRETLRVPAEEYPVFPAALSFLPMLSPSETGEHLQARAIAVAERVRALRNMLEQEGAQLPRVSLLETEQMLAVAAAEQAWLEGVLADLARGALTWSEPQLRETSRKFEQQQGRSEPDSEEETR